MPVTPNPVVDKLLLAKDLRRYRDEKGLTQQQVADKLQWSREKVGRIETASTSVSPADVRRLLHLYEVADDDVIGEFEQRAEAAQRPGWNEFRGLLPSRYLTYLGFEEIATTMRQYHLSLIPGLLQTRAYMREVLTYVHEISPRDVRRLIEVRLRRQQLLTAERRPNFKIIIDEAVLRRPVGGDRLWRDQLEHLREANQYEGVDLMVLPLAAGPHPGMRGAFNLLTFEDAPYDDLLYIENSEGDRMDRDDDEVVMEYMQIFEELESKSIGGEKFDEMVAKIAGLSVMQTTSAGSPGKTPTSSRQLISSAPHPPRGAQSYVGTPPAGSRPGRHWALGVACLAAAPERRCVRPGPERAGNELNRAANAAANGGGAGTQAQPGRGARQRRPARPGANRSADLTPPGGRRPTAAGSGDTPKIKIQSDDIEMTDPHLLSVRQIAKFLVVHLVLKRRAVLPKLLAVLLAVSMYPDIKAALPRHAAGIGHLDPREVMIVAVAVLGTAGAAAAARAVRRWPRTPRQPGEGREDNADPAG